jgi:selenocysteine lyase/cysteine desulfurase
LRCIADGAHSFGLLDFKIPDLHCDYFGTSLHKFLSAPIGTGMMWVKADKIEKVWPLTCNSARRTRRHPQVRRRWARAASRWSRGSAKRSISTRASGGAQAAAHLLPEELLGDAGANHAEGQAAHFAEARVLLRHLRGLHRRHDTRAAAPRCSTSTRSTRSASCGRTSAACGNAACLYDAARPGQVSNRDRRDSGERLGRVSSMAMISGLESRRG